MWQIKGIVRENEWDPENADARKLIFLSRPVISFPNLWSKLSAPPHVNVGILKIFLVIILKLLFPNNSYDEYEW